MFLGEIGRVGSGSGIPPSDDFSVKPKQVSKQQKASDSAELSATQAGNLRTVADLINNPTKGSSKLSRLVGSILRKLSPDAKAQLLEEVTRRNPRLFPPGLAQDSDDLPKNISDA